MDNSKVLAEVRTEIHMKNLQDIQIKPPNKIDTVSGNNQQADMTVHQIFFLRFFTQNICYYFLRESKVKFHRFKVVKYVTKIYQEYAFHISNNSHLTIIGVILRYS